jgi:hypothetical protein
MNFLKKLFSPQPKPTYEHHMLGTLQALRLNGESTVWMTNWEVLSEPVELFLKGTEQFPSLDSITALEKLIDTSTILDEARSAVLDTLRNADDAYPADQFDRDMRLAAIHVDGDDSFEISYEQRNEPYYHFNALFRNGRSQGVSIDS